MECCPRPVVGNIMNYANHISMLDCVTVRARKGGLKAMLFDFFRGYQAGGVEYNDLVVINGGNGLI